MGVSETVIVLDPYGASRFISVFPRRGLTSPQRVLSVAPELGAMGGLHRLSEMLHVDLCVQVAVDRKTTGPACEDTLEYGSVGLAVYAQARA